MKPYSYKDDELELLLDVDDNGIMYLKVSGDLGKSKIKFLREWSNYVKKVTKDLYKKKSNKILVLIDASSANEVDAESLTELYDIVEHNSKFVARAAVFGANYFVRIIVELAIHATKRKKMKIFKTREDAMEYLLQDNVKN